MENLIISLECVVPVFVTIICGYYIRIKRLVPEKCYSYLSSISFNVLLPCLQFRNAYTADFKKAFSKELILYLICETLLVFAISFLIYSRSIRDHRTRGTAIQAAYRTNIAVVGIAMAQNLMGQDGAAAMTIAIAFLLPLFNILAVITLEVCRGEKVVLRKGSIENLISTVLSKFART